MAFLAVEFEGAVRVQRAREFQQCVVSTGGTELFGGVFRDVLAGEAFEDESFRSRDRHSVGGEQFDAQLDNHVLHGEIGGHHCDAQVVLLLLGVLRVVQHPVDVVMGDPAFAVVLFRLGLSGL